MKSNLFKQFLGRIGLRRDSDSAFDVVGELVSAAQVHFAQDFPNPERLGCPPSETLSDLILNRMMPNEEVRAHLLICSECFRYYKAALSAQRELTPVVVSGRNLALTVLRRIAIPVLAGLTILILISAIVITTRRQRRQDTGIDMNLASLEYPSPPSASTVSHSESSPKKEPPVEQAQRPSIKVGEAIVQRNRPPRLRTNNRVTIDLGAISMLRDGKSTRIASLILLATRNQIVIKLPPNSPRGDYDVSLADPFGNTVRSTAEQSENGKTLRTKLNLKVIKPGGYLICVTRRTEVPECVPVTIRGH